MQKILPHCRESIRTLAVPITLVSAAAVFAQVFLFSRRG
jgi:hypothetical protein